MSVVPGLSSRNMQSPKTRYTITECGILLEKIKTVGEYVVFKVHRSNYDWWLDGEEPLDEWLATYFVNSKTWEAFTTPKEKFDRSFLNSLYISE
jgi:hypothetical protein